MSTNHTFRTLYFPQLEESVMFKMEFGTITAACRACFFKPSLFAAQRVAEMYFYNDSDWFIKKWIETIFWDVYYHITRTNRQPSNTAESPKCSVVIGVWTGNSQLSLSLCKRAHTGTLAVFTDQTSHSRCRWLYGYEWAAGAGASFLFGDAAPGQQQQGQWQQLLVGH